MYQNIPIFPSMRFLGPPMRLCRESTNLPAMSGLLSLGASRFRRIFPCEVLGKQLRWMHRRQPMRALHHNLQQYAMHTIYTIMEQWNDPTWVEDLPLMKFPTRDPGSLTPSKVVTCKILVSEFPEPTVRSPCPMADNRIHKTWEHQEHSVYDPRAWVVASELFI